MKVTFLGLSCFLIESENGSRILIDPYNDSPEFSLGLKLPPELQADLFLLSHPDEDHSGVKSVFTRKDFKAEFPNLNLRGTLVREFGGDLNIAFSFSVDGKRFLHLADNAWELSESQMSEIGEIDILFISPPKVKSSDVYIKNIKKLNPKVTILSHHIPPNTTSENEQDISNALKKIVIQDWITNNNADEQTVEVMTNIYMNGLALKKEFSDFVEVKDEVYEISGIDDKKDTTIVQFQNLQGIINFK